MALQQHIGRLNVLLELFSEWAQAPDLDELIRICGGRIRWVIDFQRLTLVLCRDDGVDVWTVTRACERFQRTSISELPATDAALIEEVLTQRLPSSAYSSVLCTPLEVEGELIGALCFSYEQVRYTYQDTRLMHHIAQFLGGAIARLDRAVTIRRQTGALNEAQASNRTKDEFLAMLGHELRNPLAPILTAAQLMKLRAGDTAPKELQIIERQALHLASLVEDLLDVSRLTAGKVELTRTPMELAVAVARAVETASPLIAAREHRLVINVPRTGLCVLGDEGRLSQVIANFLTNAARYTEPGGQVEVRAHREGNEVVLAVTDTGMGISPVLLPHIFELFVQGHRSLDRAKGGLGLGLSIAQSLTRLHGGTISATSAGPGQGSCFSIRLPAVDSRPVAVPAPVPDVAGNPALRVLVVDDNQDAAEMMSTLLATAGHDVRATYDASSALELVDDWRPDIAVLDIGLPVMDGYELARELRSRTEPEAPFMIAVTGFGQDQDRVRTSEAGFARHLVKPVDGAQLLREIAARRT